MWWRKGRRFKELVEQGCILDNTPGEIITQPMRGSSPLPHLRGPALVDYSQCMG